MEIKLLYLFARTYPGSLSGLHLQRLLPGEFWSTTTCARDFYPALYVFRRYDQAPLNLLVGRHWQLFCAVTYYLTQGYPFSSERVILLNHSLSVLDPQATAMSSLKPAGVEFVEVEA